jgi:hypothetical protein
MSGFGFFNIVAILAARYLRAKSEELRGQFGSQGNRVAANPPEPARVGQTAVVEELYPSSRAMKPVNARRRAF